MKSINKVCIFGNHVADILCNNIIRGGAELQMALLAKALAAKDIRVVVVDLMAERDIQPRSNLSIKGFPNWNRGIRGLRMFTRRIPMVLQVLKNIEADVYYVRGCTFFYLFPLIFAKLRRATFALAVASDSDLLGFGDRYNSFYKNNCSFWDWFSTVIPNELLSAILIKRADVILVQHKHQQDLAHQRRKVSILLKNIVGEDLFRVTTKGDRKNIVVVGALSARKSLRVLLPTIAKLSSVTFEFIGGAEDHEGAEIKNELAKFPNVILCGALDRQQTLSKIAGAKALVNTSRLEGFPNTFLEAWALGTPVISLYFDPADLMKTHHLGYTCDGRIDLMEELLLCKEYDILPDRTQEYVRQNHTAESAVRVFLQISGKTDPHVSSADRKTNLLREEHNHSWMSTGSPKLRILLRSVYHTIYGILPRPGKKFASSVDLYLANRPRIYFDHALHPPNGLPKGVVTFSLDFEMAWGWQYAKNEDIDCVVMGLQERKQVPVILAELEKYSLPATWATVGHLFLEECSRDMHGMAHPDMPRLPHFKNLRWNFDSGDWYQFDPCTDVRSGPAWYAPDLIEKILASKVKHEIGAHSFSHVGFGPYCSEEVASAEIQRCNEAMRHFDLTPATWVFPGNECGHYHALYQNDIRIIRCFPISNPVISLPLLRHDGLWAVHASSAIDRGGTWTYEQRLMRLKKYVDTAGQKRLAMHLWLHPSLSRSDMENVFFPFLKYCAEQRDRGNIDVLTLKELVSSTMTALDVTREKENI